MGTHYTGTPPGPAPSPGTLGLFKLVQLGSPPFPPDMFKLGHYKVEKRAVRIPLECFLVITVCNISCGKVMFSQASVILSTGGFAWWRRGVCGRGHVWQGACVAGGMHGRGHAWWGECMAGGMHGRGHAWWEEGSMHGRGHAWCGACVAGGMHDRGMHGRGHAWQGRVCMAGGHAWQERQPLQRTVRILLECILLYIYFNSVPPSQCEALSICFPSDLVLRVLTEVHSIFKKRKFIGQVLLMCHR